MPTVVIGSDTTGVKLMTVPENNPVEIINIGVGVGNAGSSSNTAPILGRTPSIAQNQTVYLSINPTSNDTVILQDPSDPTQNRQYLATLMPVAGVLNNFWFNVATAPNAEQPFTLTVMKNGVAQTLAVALSNPDKIVTDTTNSVTIAAGDLLSLRIATAATSGVLIGALGFKFVPSS
jgi:hypothetical protein